MTFQGVLFTKLPDRDMGHLWDNGAGDPDQAPLIVTNRYVNVSISPSVRNPDTTPLRVVAIPSLTNPVERLDHAKREVVRYFDIPADAVIAAAHRAEELGRT